MSSWFYKLRRRKRSEAAAGFRAAGRSLAAAAGQKPPPPSPRTPAAPRCSPNRASYYFPSKDRAALPSRHARGNPRLRDTRFPGSSPRPSGGGVDDVMHELRLRPIITCRTAEDGHEASDSSSSSSSAASPTATAVARRRRLHARARPSSSSGRRTVNGPPATETTTRKPRRLYESVVVLVKESAEPEEDFLASMAEVMAASDVRSPRSLEDLLACYLALNAAEHHGAIVSAFRRAWLDCVCVPHPPPTRESRRCRLHARGVFDRPAL